jgi:hypothetical protein
LSSLVDTAGSVDHARRNRALDALTYSIAGAVAPPLVAVLASFISPRLALLALCCLGLLGACLVVRLPVAMTDTEPESQARQLRSTVAKSAQRCAPPVPRGWRTAFIAMWGDARLRQVVILTWTGAFVVAAALLAGMSLGELVATGGGGWVAAAFGTGSLRGGLFLTARPLHTDPARGMVRWVWLLVPVLSAAALFGASFPTLMAVFAVMGWVVAPQTVLSLAARGEYAPAGDRGSVFVTVAGTKVAFSAAGTATAGLTSGLPPTQTLGSLAVVGAGAVTTAALAGRPGRHGRQGRHAGQRRWLALSQKPGASIRDNGRGCSGSSRNDPSIAGAHDEHCGEKC